MKKRIYEPHEKAKFGIILGYATGNVPVYSSDYESANKQDLPDHDAYKSYIDNIFLGYKWQCVEFARRWLYLNKGYIFADIAMAHDIFLLQEVIRLADNKILPLKSFRNGSLKFPEPGCLLVWEEGGEFKVTGHVAIVAEVYNDKIRIFEQNVEDTIWPQGQTYSREMDVSLDSQNGYWINTGNPESQILGWLIQTEDPTHAEIIKPVDRRLFNIQENTVSLATALKTEWLNLKNIDENAYVKMNEFKLVSTESEQNIYYSITRTAEKELKRATNELHAMFLHATNYVLKHDNLLEKFCIPKQFWSKLHQSWNKRKNDMITGRFDFTMSEKGLKLYEYNADSASCHMECGKVQVLWSKNFPSIKGYSSGLSLQQQLVEAWSQQNNNDIIHILYDDNPEETYHAFFMKTAIEKAGISCKAIKGISGFKYCNNGNITDNENIPIRRVWKTWAWETALDQVRLNANAGEKNNDTIKLADILLDHDITVYEPFWTLIPSNKAILPILWMLYPNHPYLLDSQFEITNELKTSGYVTKPVVGRHGSNIIVYDDNENVISKTTGKFDKKDVIYQQLFALPVIKSNNIQICSFSVDGYYAGCCTRVNSSMILTTDSDIYPLQVIDDDL